jgi:uncharacterized protein
VDAIHPAVDLWAASFGCLPSPLPKCHWRWTCLDVCTICTYTWKVDFEWDEESKAGINFRKHGVRMPEAIPVFDDPYALTILDDETDPSEQRLITLGIGALGRLLVVVYTWRGENIRIISARPAEAHEREEYEAQR